MKSLIASTAILAASVAVAQSQTALDDVIAADTAAAADLVGKTIYAAGDGIDIAGGVGDDWDRAGEVVEIVMGDDGRLQAVMADISGYLGGVGADTLSLSPADLMVVDGVEGTVLVMPAADFSESDAAGRAEGAVAVEAEGSGVTTAAPASTETVDTDQTDSSPEMDQGPGVETDTADLDDGTVVDTDRTPATAVIEDGQVRTPSEAGLSEVGGD